MHFALTLVMFLICGVTVSGSALAVLLALDKPISEVISLFPWVAAGGFLAALPVSYILASKLLKRANRNVPH
ncbi:MAG: hypothetical protein AAFV69_09865 [Pseudomonadota bacterium]